MNRAACRALRVALLAALHAALHAALLAALSAGVPLAAQDTTAAAPAAAVARCDGATVDELVIRAEEPRVIGRSAPSWSRPLLRRLLQHATTDPSAIRPFLLVLEGQPCTTFRLEESARLLRAQPYLATATARAEPISPGDTTRVRVVVETVDEIPLVLGLRMRGGNVSSVDYGSSNAFGKGVAAEGGWRRGFAYRDGVAVRFAHYHVLGRPIRLTSAAERSPLGHDYSLGLERPFYTAFQRVGWYVGARTVRAYVSFVRPSGPALSLPYARTRADAGGVLRLGREGNLFAGPFVTFERARPRGDAVVVADTGLATDPDRTLSGRYAAFERTTLAGVFGVRALTFIRVDGFDALIGPQDVATGLQIAGALGQSVGPDGSGTALATDIYGGVGDTRSMIAARAQWEGRLEPGQWANVVASGRLAWYTRPSPRSTMILGLEYSGGWHERRPFQLALGDRLGGVPGYDDSRVVGARRAVVRAERRWVVGGMKDWLGLGVAGFAHAGRILAGGVPYGQSTGLRTSVGAGLLAAVPRQSRRLIRLDVAVPFVHDPHGGYEVRLTTSRPIRGLWREPGDVARVRAVLPPAGIFAWP